MVPLQSVNCANSSARCAMPGAPSRRSRVRSWPTRPSSTSRIGCPTRQAGRAASCAEECTTRSCRTAARASGEVPATVIRSRDRFGDPVLVLPRLGQASFRVVEAEAYRRRSAITAESTSLAPEAADTVPDAKDGPHDVRNGRLSRTDFHRRFDAGLGSVSPDLKVRIARGIREARFDGKAYDRRNGRPLSVTPDNSRYCPDPDRLQWHVTNRFRAWMVAPAFACTWARPGSFVRLGVGGRRSTSAMCPSTPTRIAAARSRTG